MEHDRHIFTDIFSWALVCLVLSSCRTGQVGQWDVKAAELRHLRQEYEKYDAAVSYLLEVNAEAMREVPDLRFVERGLHRANEMKRGSLPGESEFRRYRASHPDPENFEKTYRQCRHAFGMKAWAEALGDPDREPELRPIMILNYRHLLPKRDPNWREEFTEALKTRGLTVFDPNDPNDERLWHNIKQNIFEMAEYTEAGRVKLVEEGVPQFMRQYLGQYDVINASSELYWYWMRAYVPKTLVEAAKALHEQEQKLSAIEPGWARDIERFGRDPQAERRRMYIADSLRNILQDHFPALKDGWFETRGLDFGN